MIMVFVSIPDLRDVASHSAVAVFEALFVFQGIDGKRFTRLGTGNQVVKIASGITGPNPVPDDHGFVRYRGWRAAAEGASLHAETPAVASCAAWAWDYAWR